MGVVWAWGTSAVAQPCRGTKCPCWRGLGIWSCAVALKIHLSLPELWGGPILSARCLVWVHWVWYEPQINLPSQQPQWNKLPQVHTHCLAAELASLFKPKGQGSPGTATCEKEKESLPRGFCPNMVSLWLHSGSLLWGLWWGSIPQTEELDSRECPVPRGERCSCLPTPAKMAKLGSHPAACVLLGVGGEKVSASVPTCVTHDLTRAYRKERMKKEMDA